MLKVIIIDSDEQMNCRVKKILSKITMGFDINVSTKQYTKYDSNLNEEISVLDYKKIYIIDVHLIGDYSGIEIANKIREDDWDSEIIFATNHDKMFETVFRSIPDVFDFIEKFYHMDKRLEFDLERIIKKNFDFKTLKYKSRNYHIKIYYRSIEYIYRDTTSRKLVVVTRNNKYYLPMGINEIMSHLDKRFVMTHRACIVNTEFVSQVDWVKNIIILENGQVIDYLSKTYKNNLENIFN